MNNNLSSPTNYLPISEAAKFLGVSLDTLRRWDKTGVIKSKRLDGKNRYFALSDLKKNISNRTLSISEVSKKFNLSSTTLRRLEARGIIKPLRNKAGVRVFDSATIEAFIKSPYFQRKKYALKKPKMTAKAVIPSQGEGPVKETSKDTELATKQAPDQAPKSTLGHFLAVSTATFILLIVVGLGNVFLFKTQNYEMVPLSMVLGEKISAPARLPAPEIREIEETSSVFEQEIQVEESSSPLEKYIADSLNMINENKQKKRFYQSNFLRLVEVATDSANIHQNPDILSSIVGSAQNGEVFEFLSFDSGWIQLRLHESTQSGYLQEQYARVKEFEFSAPQSSGWSNLYEGTNSAQLTDPAQATEEGKYDQSTN
jgi:excisionase family DNA binding protein